jgi:hypothetical protein
MSFYFDDHQRNIITDYYRKKPHKHKHKSKWKEKGKRKGKGKEKGIGKNKGLPPGLAKKEGGLPPGLAKKGHLPPGIQKKMLPRDLIDQLPPAPPGTERIIYNNQVGLIEISTNIVLDVIDLSIYMRL